MIPATPARTGEARLEAARALARRANLFFIHRGDRYLVYRRLPERRLFLGSRATPDALLRLVRRCAACPDTPR